MRDYANQLHAIIENRDSLEVRRTKCWKYQMKKLRKEFGVRRREAFAGNVVTKDGLTIRFY